MRIANETLQTSPTDMGSSFNMRALWLGHICNFSIQLVFTGLPVGSFSLQCSDDPGQPNGGDHSDQSNGVVNWTDVDNSTQMISAAGNHVYQFANAGFNWVRVVYTYTSGSGTITSARANIKGV